MSAAGALRTVGFVPPTLRGLVVLQRVELSKNQLEGRRRHVVGRDNNLIGSKPMSRDEFAAQVLLMAGVGFVWWSVM